MNELMIKGTNCKKAIRYTTPQKSEVLAEGTLIMEGLRCTQANPRLSGMIDDVIRSFRISEPHRPLKSPVSTCPGLSF
jgi:hypothetical protein